MEVLKTYQDIAGKYYYKVLLTDGNIMDWSFTSTPTDQELLGLEIKYIDLLQYEGFVSLRYELLDNLDLLKEVVLKIKDNPNLNLTQYHVYLDTKSWYEQSIIQFFIFTVAKGLAEHYDKDLISLDETTVLKNVRDWIVATPALKIAKILFDE